MLRKQELFTLEGMEDVEKILPAVPLRLCGLCVKDGKNFLILSQRSQRRRDRLFSDRFPDPDSETRRRCL
jgi:hypothetical protein